MLQHHLDQEYYIIGMGLQLLVAEIISAIYGLVMVVVLVGIMLQIAEDGWLAPSSLLFFIVACQMTVAGLLHPQEATCLLCGVIYYITVPSMYMLLIIFSVFNVHNVTWGTRDSKKPTSVVSLLFFNFILINFILILIKFKGTNYKYTVINNCQITFSTYFAPLCARV